MLGLKVGASMPGCKLGFLNHTHLNYAETIHEIIFSFGLIAHVLQT